MSRRPFERPVSRTGWYVQNPRYRNYMLRELTCVVAAVYCILMLYALAVLASGNAERWAVFLNGQQHPAWVVFHAFALVFFIVYQTMAWFRLAPKAMPLQLGGAPVPAGVIVAAHYGAWVVVTVLIFWLTGVF